jgi:hypothetical protein
MLVEVLLGIKDLTDKMKFAFAPIQYLFLICKIVYLGSKLEEKLARDRSLYMVRRLEMDGLKNTLRDFLYLLPLFMTGSIDPAKGF